LKDKADLELDEVLRKQGFVTGTPVHFPYCTRLYEPGTITLIGPLANRGRQCEFWTEAKAAEPLPWQKAFTQVRYSKPPYWGASRAQLNISGTFATRRMR
jgi:hypothetical protein